MNKVERKLPAVIFVAMALFIHSCNPQDKSHNQRGLDYIFASKNLVKRLNRAQIISNDTTKILSDYLPVVVELYLGN